MVTLGVLFTGSFVASFLRMTEGNGEGICRALQASPNRGGAERSEAEGFASSRPLTTPQSALRAAHHRRKFGLAKSKISSLT